MGRIGRLFPFCLGGAGYPLQNDYRAETALQPSYHSNSLLNSLTSASKGVLVLDPLQVFFVLDGFPFPLVSIMSNQV